MSEKPRVRTQLGCAPVPFATGRIPGKLPVISALSSPNGRESDNIGGVRVWFPSKDDQQSKMMPPVCTNGFMSSVDRRFSLDQVRLGSFKSGVVKNSSATFLSAGKLTLKGHMKSAISLDVSLGDLETVKRMSAAVPLGGLWLRTDKNRLRTRAKSADNARDDAWTSDLSPEDIDSGQLGMCRYTPLPAIGCLTKEEAAAMQSGKYSHEDLLEISRPDVDRELRNLQGSLLDNGTTLWNSTTEVTLEKPKLPPLRPIVRSRTFTIISSALSNGDDNGNEDDCKSNEEEVDDMSNWEDDRSDSTETQMSEDDGIVDDQEILEDKPSDEEEVHLDTQETDRNSERDTLLCVGIRLPNGDELQKYFDFEDTLETVLNFALHRFNETSLTEVEELPRYQLQLDNGEETPRVFDDFTKTLCELGIPDRTRFYLQPVENEQGANDSS